MFDLAPEFVFELLPPVVHQRSWTLSYDCPPITKIILRNSAS